MRNLFLALVLANLAFAAWQSWFATPTRPAGRAAAEVPEIMLASELQTSLPVPGPADAAPLESPVEEAPAVAAAAAAPEVEPAVGEAADGAPTPAEELAAAPAAPAPAAEACVSVGPFRELSQAATAAATLRADGLDPVQRVAEGDVWVGYWVYIAAIPSVEQAEEILAKLRANGITDSYVIPNSDSGNLVSLGVFTEIARAGTRLNEVRELGYEATVADRTRRATVYWVDVLLEAGRTLDFEALQPQGRIIRLEQRRCDQAVG